MRERRLHQRRLHGAGRLPRGREFSAAVRFHITPGGMAEDARTERTLHLRVHALSRGSDQGKIGRVMARFLVALGGVMLVIAYVLWRDDSSWGVIIAWFLASWGSMLIAWGLIAGWYSNAVACLAGAVFAAAAATVALRWIQVILWEAAILCAIGSLLAFAIGVARARHLLAKRSP